MHCTVLCRTVRRNYEYCTVPQRRRATAPDEPRDKLRSHENWTVRLDLSGNSSIAAHFESCSRCLGVKATVTLDRTLQFMCFHAFCSIPETGEHVHPFLRNLNTCDQRRYFSKIMLHDPSHREGLELACGSHKEDLLCCTLQCRREVCEKR